MDGPERFVLAGSAPEPPGALQGCFAPDGRWRYMRHSPASGWAGAYREHFRQAAMLVRAGASLFHATTQFVPLWAPCPIVLTVYDLMFELFPEYEPAVRSRPYRIYRFGARRLVRRWIAISERTARDARVRWGLDTARLDVVPLGSSLAELQPSREPRNPVLAGLGAAPLVVSPFNLEPRKNLRTLVSAFAALESRYTDPTRPRPLLVLYGRAAVTPEREATFERLVASLPLEGRVIRTGVLEEPDLAWLHARADVFVFPSLYEGFGLPLLEAMAAGASAVAHDDSAMAEVAGDAAVLVDARSPEHLALAVGSLLGDPERRRALGARARARAQQFSVGRMAAGTLAVYRRALGIGE